MKPAKAKIAKSRTRSRTRRSCERVKSVMEDLEEWIHYLIAAVLIVIATTVMGDAVWTLMTSSTTFAVAATSAVGGVMFALILVEITRTVVIPPDKSIAMRGLFMIAIVSALREVLVVSAGSMVRPASPHDQLTGMPLEAAISAAVVISMAAAFVLVRRSGSKSS